MAGETGRAAPGQEEIYLAPSEHNQDLQFGSADAEDIEWLNELDDGAIKKRFCPKQPRAAGKPGHLCGGVRRRPSYWRRLATTLMLSATITAPNR
jgi:hypothetical protein